MGVPSTLFEYLPVHDDGSRKCIRDFGPMMEIDGGPKFTSSAGLVGHGGGHGHYPNAIQEWDVVGAGRLGEADSK